MSIKAKIDRAATRALRYVYNRFYVDHRRHRPLEIVYERASQASADFILANIASAVLFDNRDSYWKYVCTQLPASGLLMECGVFQGASINFIADNLRAHGDSRTVFGFDSFEGLEEDWSGENLSAGFFDQKGKMPTVRSNVHLLKGWVQDTVPPFLLEHSLEKVALLHIDTDTYSPARFLLDALEDRLTSGTIIAFDELIGYPNWQGHEYKALIESLDESRYEFIAFTSRQAAIRIL